jgi:hypothetical protein
LPLLDIFKRKINPISSQGNSQQDWRCRKEVKELSTQKPRILQADLVQDEALRSSRPVIWIPKDELGIADDEISHVRRTYGMWISNESASLDERGNLKLWGPPPTRG